MRRSGTDGSTVWISSKYSYTVLCCTVPGLRVGESSTVRAYYSTALSTPLRTCLTGPPAGSVDPVAQYIDSPYLWKRPAPAPPECSTPSKSTKLCGKRDHTDTQTHRHRQPRPAGAAPEQGNAIMGQRKGVMARRRSCFRSGVMHVCKLVRGIGHGLGSGLDFCARLLGWGTADGTR